jgi:hypothetical protein
MRVLEALRMAAGEAASFPTDVKGVLALLVKSRQSVSNAMGVRITRGMARISLAFNRCMQDRLSKSF